MEAACRKKPIGISDLEPTLLELRPTCSQGGPELSLTLMPSLGKRWHIFLRHRRVVGKTLLISPVIFNYVYYKIFSFFLEPLFGESVYLAASLLLMHCSRPLEMAQAVGFPVVREDSSSSGSPRGTVQQDSSALGITALLSHSQEAFHPRVCIRERELAGGPSCGQVILPELFSPYRERYELEFGPYSIRAFLSFSRTCSPFLPFGLGQAYSSPSGMCH